MKLLPVLFFVLVLFTAPAGAGYLITEFCPDGYASGDGDEYFILSGTGDLTSYAVSDGEGTISFPENRQGPVTVARSAEGYFSIYKTYPDYEIIESEASVPNVKTAGKFQMANSGDSLSLYKNGYEIQTVTWPDDVATSNGRVHVLNDGVWDTRVYKIGQSRFSPETFIADSATLFVSPDCSFEVVTKAIDDAKATLCIAVYEFESPAIARHVAAASARGVDVTILVEGGPVGGMSDEEKGVLNYLTAAGADVYTIESVDKLPARYRYHHAKYLIADGSATLVLSENLGDTGIPKTGTAGNRGWGALVQDKELAAYFTKVFESDLAGYDIYPWKPTKTALPEEKPGQDTLTVFHPLTLENVKITPVIAPDTSSLIEDLLQGAYCSLDIEQAYISPWPGGVQNAWLAIALEKAKQGISVRVILDGMYYNTEDDADNDELVATLNRLDLPVSARLINPGDTVLKLHNKGVIADGRSVLISSINWSYNSPVNNREAGLIIEDTRAAKYYTKVFDLDFEGEKYEEPLSYGLGFDLRFLLAGGIVLILILILIIRRRR
ncbi:MAG TPA: phospholipase D-like domain-containing protein [Methanocorpusculum sp.]|nr:phospholipase D-like domain-containing protein [Methanocorpusculum sp.]